MKSIEPLARGALLSYFQGAASPREEWQVGMEVERLGRHSDTSEPLAYDGEGPSVRKALEFYQARRGGDPVMEATHLIGLDGPWGTISLEPGGQFEWSSKPQADLDALRRSLMEHVVVLRETGRALNITWSEEAVDPVHPVSAMPWMPKARYNIMRPFLGARGRLAHRMMTQTTSIQCAFDYADPEDWRRKFKAAALLSPVATALFANSSRIDGRDSGYRSYRQQIWRETDPARCGLPPVVFDPAFDLAAWLDWLLDVPTIFLHRARGLVPAGGVPFRDLLTRVGCDALKLEDWETHLSTIFTELRSSSYIEIRSADMQPESRVFSVPVFWTGILYHEDALGQALELVGGLDDHERWSEAMHVAARDGLDATIGSLQLGELARRALDLSAHGLGNGAACVGDPDAALSDLELLKRDNPVLR